MVNEDGEEDLLLNTKEVSYFYGRKKGETYLPSARSVARMKDGSSIKLKETIHYLNCIDGGNSN